MQKAGVGGQTLEKVIEFRKCVGIETYKAVVAIPMVRMGKLRLDSMLTLEPR